MKLFQQLLVAPAALGLLAPLAANAAEVNINDVANYAAIEEYELEVSSAQFSDVVPGDWAYTALQNLSESYGCVDNAYTNNLKNGQALTRYEAAALVNDCLQGGVASAEVNSDVIRLTNEFGTEMAILKGRVDGLENKVTEISAGQFSSATKLSGQAVFTTGMVDSGLVGNDNKLAFQYAYTTELNTSFNGTDMLTVGIDSGSADGSMDMDSAVTPTNGSNVVEIASLYYSFPVGDFQVTAGPLLDQDDVISATTSVYSDAFRLSSMPWSTVGTTGAGAAISYANDEGFNASVSSVSSAGSLATQGLWTKESPEVITLSAGYDSDNYGFGIIYTDIDNAQTSQLTAQPVNDSSFGVGAWFTPENWPTISFSYDTLTDGDAVDSSDFMIGLDKALGAGTASLAYQSRDASGTSSSNYEFYYNYPVNDGVSIQGGVFVEEDPTVGIEDTVGYMVETFFSF